MKIGLVRHNMDDPQGGARQVALLARDLQQLGADVTVYCYRYDKQRCFPDILAGVRVRAARQVTLPGRLRSERGWRRVVAQLRRYYLEAPAIASLIAPDTEMLNPHEWLAHRAAALFTRRHKVPVVWSYNDPSGWHRDGNRKFHLPLENLFGWFDTRLVNRFAGLTTLDHRMQAVARSSFSTPAHIIRSGVDSRFFDQPQGAPTANAARAPGLRLLSVGVLFPHRRFEDAIRAFHRAREGNANWSYEIIGSPRFSPAYGAFLRALVRELDLDAEVSLRFETVSEDQLEAAFGSADALIFPNEDQTWGLAVLEAMARSLPVVVSRGAGVHEVLTDGVNALLVDVRQPDQIATAIKRLAHEPALRVALGSAGRRLVRESYTSQHYAIEMLRLFRKCLGDPRAN